jgi:citrate synthase
MRERAVAAESTIRYIDGDAGILTYNGYNIHTLAERATFEEVVFFALE